jgi:hypothetical protein
MRENFGFVTHTRPALATLWHRCRLLNCHSGFCAHCFALCAECGTDSVWGQPQMEPSWTPYRDVLMPSKSRAKRTLLGQGICSKGGGEASSADRECGSASIQRGGHPPTKRLVRAVPGGHRRFPTGYNSTDLQVARPRARTGTSCRLACRQGQTRITGLTTWRSYPGGAGIEFHCPIHRGVQRIPVHDDAHYVGSSNGRVPRFRSS